MAVKFGVCLFLAAVACLLRVDDSLFARGQAEKEVEGGGDGFLRRKSEQIRYLNWIGFFKKEDQRRRECWSVGVLGGWGGLWMVDGVGWRPVEVCVIRLCVTTQTFLAGADQRRLSFLIPIESSQKEFSLSFPSVLDYPLPPESLNPLTIYSLLMLVQPLLVSNNPSLSRLVPADP